MAREWVDKWNTRIQGYRGMLLAPLLKLLTTLGITANSLTNFRMAMVPVFLVWFFKNSVWAAWFLLVVMLLDTVDGALARYQKTSSDRGKFLDIFTDHVTHFALLFTFPWLGADTYWVLLYFFAVSSAYVLGTLKKEEFTESDWIIRPYPRLSYIRTVVAIAFYFKVVLAIDFLDFSLVLAGSWSLYLCVYYYIYIQRRWKRRYK